MRVFLNSNLIFFILILIFKNTFPIQSQVFYSNANGNANGLIVKYHVVQSQLCDKKKYKLNLRMVS